MRSRSLYTLAISALLIAQSVPVSAQPIGLPNSKLTPGATNPNVNQQNIASTICVVGYTSTIRPPVSYTNGLKLRQLNSGYNVQGDLNLKNYEEDHLIPLSVGGHPTSPKNLFPQYYAATYGARVKDKLELKVHLMICAGQISLKAAQALFVPDWTAGYKKIYGSIPR